MPRRKKDDPLELTDGKANAPKETNQCGSLGWTLNHLQRIKRNFLKNMMPTNTPLRLRLCRHRAKHLSHSTSLLKQVLSDDNPYEKIYIVRSLVATREIGFLPGDHEDKSSLYQIPQEHG